MGNKLLILGLLLFSSIGNAQIAYRLEVLTDAYVDLDAPISLNNGEIWDDPEYVIPLGFELILGDQLMDTVYIVNFGGGAFLSSSPVDAGTESFFMPIGQDLIDLGDGTGASLSPISYKTVTIANTQVCIIEWKNAGFFEDITQTDFINVQLWLYETGDIEYRYGPNQINNPSDSFEGLTGPIVSLAPSFNSDTGQFVENAYLLEGDAASPSPIIIMPGQEAPEIGVQGSIPADTVYRFVFEVLGVSENEMNQVYFYPNPVQDVFELKSQTQIRKISLFNTVGQNVKLESISANKYNISNLPAGVYFLTLELKNTIVTQRLVKE